MGRSKKQFKDDNSFEEGNWKRRKQAHPEDDQDKHQPKAVDQVNSELPNNDEPQASTSSETKPNQALANLLDNPNVNFQLVKYIKKRLAKGKAIDAFDAFTRTVRHSNYHHYYELLIEIANSWWSALAKKKHIDTNQIERFRKLVKIIYEANKKRDCEFWEKVVASTKLFMDKRNVKQIKPVMFGLREAFKDIRKFIIESKKP